MADCKGMRGQASWAAGAALCLLGAAIWPDAALAQSQSEASRAAGERDRQGSLTGALPSRRELPPSLGEIRLLRPTDLFYVVIDPEVEYTDNAFYSRGGDQDVVYNPSAAVGIQTTVADLVQVELETGLSAFYHHENSVLDGVSPYVNLEFSGEAGPVDLEFDIIYELSYETAFSTRNFSSVSTILVGYWPIDINDWFTIEPFALAQRTFRNPSASQFYQGEVGAEFEFDLTDRLFLSLEGYLAYGESDNQIDATTGDVPNFLVSGTTAEISYGLLPWLQVTLNINYFRNESNITGSSYDRFTIGPSFYSEFHF